MYYTCVYRYLIVSLERREEGSKKDRKTDKWTQAYRAAGRRWIGGICFLRRNFFLQILNFKVMILSKSLNKTSPKTIFRPKTLPPDGLSP